MDDLIPMPTLIDPAAQTRLECGHAYWSEHSFRAGLIRIPVFCGTCGKFSMPGFWWVITDA